jgi:hypothetical protein
MLSGSIRTNAASLWPTVLRGEVDGKLVWASPRLTINDHLIK